MSSHDCLAAVMGCALQDKYEYPDDGAGRLLPDPDPEIMERVMDKLVEVSMPSNLLPGASGRLFFETCQ